MKKKTTRPPTTSSEEFEKLQEQHARTQRMLAERIAFHQARIAERKRATGDSAS
jgi:hypothetical protein